MWKKYEDFTDEDLEVLEEEDLVVEASSTKRYIAVKGISLDKFKARFRPGDEIPLEYLQDPDVAFEWLLNKKAIKEVGSE
ncbi:MAG: hypothetical protein ACW99G_17575 [Candidatus Thorarchaeota archaeon]|jgi:hypothetical protein